MLGCSSRAVHFSECNRTNYYSKASRSYSGFEYVLDINIHICSTDLILTYAGILKLSLDYLMN